MKWLIAVIACFLCACTATQNVPLSSSPRAGLERPTFNPVTPVELPEAFEYDVKDHEIDGIRYVLVRREDIAKIQKAYISAESNSELVTKLSELNELQIKKLNAAIDILEFEEVRNEKLKAYINEDQQLRQELQRNTEYEMWMWKILAAAGLLIGL